MNYQPYSLAAVNREPSPILPPSNIEAEQALLGAILVNNAAFREVEGLVDADDFSEPVHQDIFRACGSVISSGRLAVPITLKSIMPEYDLGGMTITQYLSRLAAEAITVIEAPDYARAIKTSAMRAAGFEVAAELRDALLSPSIGASPIDIMGRAITDLQRISETGASKADRYDAGDATAAMIAKAEAIARGERNSGIVQTGFPSLDRATGGYMPGTLWIIGARPGMGKTAFAVTSARMVAHSGEGATIFSLEVPQEQIAARCLSDLTFHNGKAVAFGDIMRGQIDVTASDLWKLRNAQKRIADLPLSWFDPTNIPVSEIALRVRAEKRRLARRGIVLRAVFVDYLKFIKPTNRYKGNKVYEIGEITGALKQLAKDEDLCVIALAQLKRAESREKKGMRPTLDDLRESGDIEADADVVCFIHRESYYIRQSDEFIQNKPEALAAFADKQFDAELIIGKARAGATPTVRAKCFMPSSSIFEGNFTGVNGRGEPLFDRPAHDDNLELM